MQRADCKRRLKDKDRDNDVADVLFTPQEIGLPAKFREWRENQAEALEQVTMDLEEKRFVAYNMPTGCHPAGQKILMFDGRLVPVERIEAGDLLMGPDSAPKTVLSLLHGHGMIYKVTPVKGDSFFANEDHILSLESTEDGRGNGGVIRDISIRDYLGRSSHFRHMHKLFRRAVEFPFNGSPLPVDPYFLGVLLGDGCPTHGVEFSKPDPEMKKLAEEQAEIWDLDVTTKSGDTYALVGNFNRWYSNPLTDAIRGLGLYGLRSLEKFIPFLYKTSSRENRIKLLAGLVDTDGSIDCGCCDYISASENLARDCAFVARSLGFAAYVNPCEKSCQNDFHGNYWRVSISGDLSILPCRIPRKQAVVRRQKKSVLRTGFKVESTGEEQDYFGFELDGDGRYLLDDFTVTHNTGKSPWYVSLALMMGWRTLILTRTKGLQGQLMADFEEVGLTDIRGRSNYPCHMASHMTCEDGAHAGCLHNKGQSQGAMLRERCPYREARQAAMAARLVITNYSYWPLINWYGEGLGQFDLIVLDESHEAPQAVCEVMSVTLSAREVYRMLDSRWPDNADDAGIDTWSGWARAMMPRTARAAESLKQEVRDQGGTASERLLKEAAHWRSLLSKLGTIAGAEGPWASEQTRISEATGYRLEPLWPAQYAERALFRGIPRVLFVSATVQEKTLSLMGLKEDDYIFREWPWIFPVNRSPIYWLDTVSVGAKMSAEDEAVLFNQIDSLLASRGDRKAIIQSVSYKLKDKILEASVYANRMIAHEQNSVSTAAAVQRFKLSGPPAVLVSPSISTGYDFPFSDCELNIIPKLPFPIVKSSRIMEARCRKDKGGDPGYADYLMVQDLVQACGRSMRAPDDRSETFLLDNNFRWVKYQCRKQFPGWFWRLYHKRVSAPSAPPILSTNNR